MTISVDLSADAEAEPDLRPLPTAPGVFALEAGDGRTLALAITANLRRLVRARLSSPAESDRPTRRVDYRSLARRAIAMTVGSAFEADWAYLQHARLRLPGTFRALLDRWRGWFVHCNPDSAFPRFVKTCTPGAPPAGRSGAYLGPFADKHAAQRGIELLQGLFDLCRYHHILVQAPNAAACAYKEMGKCPAPCDGSVSMDSYRRMIRGAIEFVADPRDRRRAGIEAEMHRAGKALDFERAQRLRQRLEAAADFDKPPFRFVDRIEQFRFVAVLPSERVDHARLLLINGGWIEPVADAPIGLSPHELDAVVDAIEKRLEEAPPEFSPDAVQNIGLVCWHLFRPRKARVPGELLPARPGVDRKDLAAAIRKLRRSAPAVGEDESAAAGIAEAEMESAT